MFTGKKMLQMLQSGLCVKCLCLSDSRMMHVCDWSNAEKNTKKARLTNPGFLWFLVKPDNKNIPAVCWTCLVVPRTVFECHSLEGFNQDIGIVLRYFYPLNSAPMCCCFSWSGGVVWQQKAAKWSLHRIHITLKRHNRLRALSRHTPLQPRWNRSRGLPLSLL